MGFIQAFKNICLVVCLRVFDEDWKCLSDFFIGIWWYAIDLEFEKMEGLLGINVEFMDKCVHLNEYCVIFCSNDMK